MQVQKGVVQWVFTHWLDLQTQTCTEFVLRGGNCLYPQHFMDIDFPWDKAKP